MILKKTVIIIFLLYSVLFYILPTYKIYAQTSNPNSIMSNISAVGSQSVKNIEKIIGENTPEFIARPIVLGASTIENFRQDIGDASENKKVEIQSQIKAMDVNKNNNTEVAPDSENTNTGVNKFLKPFKYMELFFFTFLSYILNNKFIFYWSFVVIIFLILRYIWHLIF